MSNFGYQTQRNGGGTIANGEAISFNNMLIDLDSTITYNDSTFTLASNADYYISWFVTLKTGLGIKGPTISLITNQDPQAVYPSTNSIKTGQISGSAIIRALEGTTFQLINQTGQSIVLADNVNITANISIVEINRNNAGIDLLLKNSPAQELLGGETVPFDTVFASLNNSITNTSGIITITNPAKYVVDWSVSLDGSLDATSIRFNLVSSIGNTSSIVGVSENPLSLQGTIYGRTILDLSGASPNNPYTLQLVNASADASGTLAELTFSNLIIQASMRIVQI